MDLIAWEVWYGELGKTRFYSQKNKQRLVEVRAQRGRDACTQAIIKTFAPNVNNKRVQHLSRL
ncbi:MAG: hypothetical protein GX552_15025 [Chloroflexi bacterium]|jgi:hypothetical protein|nr:hypothetical protein [Chloroflexota bacterium]